MTDRARNAARQQWSRVPAGTNYVGAEEGSADFYRGMTETRYAIQPWHRGLLGSFAPEGRLLEIGSGAGTDHFELAQMAECTVAIDLAYHGAWLTKRRLELAARSANSLVADGERLPFRACTFDAVYSFGVIHHTDNPEVVVREMQRVMRPGAKFLVALYHRESLFAFVTVLRWLKRGAPGRWRDFLATVEYGAAELDDRPLVRLNSQRGARRLFESFDDVRTNVVHLGLGLDTAAPPRLVKALSRFGWYVVITGRKPAS